MPKLVIRSDPSPALGTPGTLPFMFTGAIEGVLFPVSPVWPTPGAVTDAGVAYDHEMEVARSAFTLVTRPNALVTVGEVRYRVVAAQANDFVPHVVVRLRRMEATI